MPTVVHYSYTTESCVMQPSEMIRNIDFAYELAKPYIDRASASLAELADKLNTVVDKINTLNSR